MAYQSYLTTLGAEQIAQAQIDGSLPAWSQMSLGDGGGSAVTASSKVTKMVNAVYTAGLNTLKTDADDSSVVIATLVVPTDVGGFTVREAGILDTDGGLVVYASIPATTKDISEAPSTMTVRLRVKIGEDAAITFATDSDTLATIEYVDSATVAAAETLATARSLITDLTSSEAASFDGSADVTLGVTGVLPEASGGTGATSLADVTVGAATEATHAESADLAATVDPHTFITDLTSEDAATYDGTADVLQGVSGVLPVAHGGTGESDLTNVTVGAADALSEAHTIQTNLASTDAASFDGTTDITPGVMGVLAVANGGTGATSLDDVSVGYATAAGTAETATTATSATSATTADYATSAGTADSAATADSATYATSAGTADSATTAESADGLKTARELITDLESTESASFDGTTDATLGVTGVLPEASGGTGATSLMDITVGAAAEADHAEEADHATSADSADSATTATNADTATTAATATTAETATIAVGVEAYSEEGTYSVGQLVTYNGGLYLCLVENGAEVSETETVNVVISPTNDTDGEYWEEAGDDTDTTDAAEYDETADYAEGDVVSVDGVYYVCITAHGPNTETEVDEAIIVAPDDDDNGSTYWQALSGGSDYVPLSGNAGEVSYYTTTADATTVDESSADAIETADAVTISDGTSGTAWVKVIHLTGDSPTVTAGDGWSWSDGESPELESGCFVVACWLGSAGLLTYHNIG